MISPPEQITHRVVDGEILPPDSSILPADDPNAPIFEPFRNRDKLSPHDAPDVVDDADGTTIPETPRAPEMVGQLEFSAPMPQDLRDMADKLRPSEPYHDPANLGVHQLKRGHL